MFKMNNDSLLSNYIKHILDNTSLPKMTRWRTGEYVIKDTLYIVDDNVKLTIKSGIPSGPNDNNYFKYIEAYNPRKLSDNDVIRFTSSQSYYDDKTHYYYGSYLRDIKESKDIDLLSMYNVWGGNIISDLKLTYNQSKQEGKLVPEIIIHNQASSIDSIYEIMEVRIKPNTDYSIFIDCDTPVLMTTIAYDDGRIISSNQYGAISYPYMRFIDPQIYRVNLQDFDSIDSGELKLVKDYLTLLIQVPKTKKNRLILEGNYKDSLPILTSNGITKKSIIKSGRGNVLINTCPNLINYLSDGDSVALSEGLDCYIVNYAITPEEEILDNIDRIQSYVTSTSFENKYGFRYNGTIIPGELNDELRTWLYNFQSKYYNFNITGFVDTRLESLIMKGVVDE